MSDTIPNAVLQLLAADTWCYDDSALPEAAPVYFSKRPMTESMFLPSMTRGGSTTSELSAISPGGWITRLQVRSR